MATHSMIDLVKLRSCVSVFTEIELDRKILKPIIFAVY